MKTADELAQQAFNDLADDPNVWGTHGLPNETKESLIVHKIAEAIRIATTE